MTSEQQPSYRHLTTGINHVPMEILRKRIRKARSRILTPLEHPKRIRVFLNGNRNFEGALLVVQPKQTLDSVLLELEAKTSNSKPLRFLYDLSGTRLVSFTQLTHGGCYVAAFGAFRNVDYNTSGKKPAWRNDSNPKGRRSSDVTLLQKLNDIDLTGDMYGKGGCKYVQETVNGKQRFEAEVDDEKVEGQTNSEIILPARLSYTYLDVSHTNTDATKHLSNVEKRDAISVSEQQTSGLGESLDNHLSFTKLLDIDLGQEQSRREMTIIYKNDRVKIFVRANQSIEDIKHLANRALGLNENSVYHFLVNGEELLDASKLFSVYHDWNIININDASTGKTDKANKRQAQQSKVENRITKDHGFKLQFVFGGNLRRAVRITMSGELIYTSGTLVVIYDQVQRIQRFYTGHTEDVTCLALHKTDALVASGQRGGSNLISNTAGSDAHVRVWTLDNLAVTSQFGHGLMGEKVLKVEFSSTNPWLAVVDPDYLTLWDWKQEAMLSRIKGAHATTTLVKFGSGDRHLVTSTTHRLTFWEIAANGDIAGCHKSGNFSLDQPELVTCATSSFDDDLVAGDSDGNITVWREGYDGAYEQSWSMHGKSAVTSLCMLGDGTLMSGDSNGFIYSWDVLRQSSSAKATRRLSESPVDFIFRRSGSSDDLLCVCENSFIIEGSFLASWNKTCLGQPAKIVAMETLADDTYVCAGDTSGNLFCWNVEDMKLLWKKHLHCEISCLDVQRDFRMIMVGTKMSQFIVTSSVDGSLVCSRYLASPISCLRFSGQISEKSLAYVAVATEDRQISIFHVLEHGRAYVMRWVINVYDIIHEMDWAMDWKFLRIRSRDGDVMTWNIETKNRDTRFSSENRIWLSHSCALDQSITCQFVSGSSLRIAGFKCGKIKVWTNEKLLSEFKCSSNGITSVCITSRLEVLCAGGSNESPVFAKWQLIKH